MTKSELIRALAKKHPHLFQKDTTALIDTILSEITDALSSGDRVELRGFGSFSVRERKPRQARNPKTNEVVNLPSRKVTYFRAGKELREKVDN